MTVVSLGPGDKAFMAPRAREALEEAQVVVGYRTYVDLIDPVLVRGKEIISTGMTQEMARCRRAIEKTLEGRTTALVCSGDAGIYGMAGLIFDLLENEDLLGKVDVEVIPGIPALCAAAALLGAPLMHDFAVISLSDLLTPWETIQYRVEAAAKADYVVVLYNPRSRKRDWQLGRVREILLRHRRPDTPVGVVRNAMREDQLTKISTLSGFDDSSVDMFSIVVVGNSQTRVAGGRMLTPRGYMRKYGAGGAAHGEREPK